MQKIIAHTTGKFQLIDQLSGDLISAHRPSVISKTPFVTARLGLDQVVIVAEVKPEATDEEFAKHWKEANGDMDLAVESFLSQFGLDAEGEPETPRSTARGGRKQTSAATE